MARCLWPFILPAPGPVPPVAGARSYWRGVWRGFPSALCSLDRLPLRGDLPPLWIYSPAARDAAASEPPPPPPPRGAAWPVLLLKPELSLLFSRSSSFCPLSPLCFVATWQCVAKSQREYWITAGRATTRLDPLQRPRPTETEWTPRTGTIILRIFVYSITCWRPFGQPNKAIMLCLLSTDNRR